MNKVVHIKTARVTGHEADGSATVERHTLKIEDGRSFDNFLKHINLKGFMIKEPPRAVIALEQKLDKKGALEWVEVDPKSYQARIEEAMNPVSKGGKEVDFKALSEKQAKELAESRATNASIMERLEALEGGKSTPVVDHVSDDIMGTASDKIRAKAAELDINFPANIKDETLLSKIQILDPDFKA